jgi:hypothetical protein
VTSKEAMAISTLGVDHITISGAVLQALADDKDIADFRGDDLGVKVKHSEATTSGRGMCRIVVWTDEQMYTPSISWRMMERRSMKVTMRMKVSSRSWHMP